MLKITVRFDGMDMLERRLKQGCPRAAHIVAVQARKDTSPYVPALTGSLEQRTRVDGETIVYPGPYARYLYYGRVMVDSKTGKGPMRIVSEDGTEVIRFRKGARLKPTERKLRIQKTVHPRAQSHWFEASKARNLKSWERVAEEAMRDEVKK